MSRKWVIVITDRFSSDAELKLRSNPQVELRKTALPKPTLEEIKDADALIIRSRTPIDLELLNQAPKLKVICTATSGFDHIDLKMAMARKIAVMHTPEANVHSATEMTLALVLACMRKVVQAHKQLKAGDWNRDTLMGSELQGKQYGIIGLGRIGSRMALLAQALGMSVAAYDPYQEASVFSGLKIRRLGLEEILKESDIISFHVPKTKQTHHMLNRSRLEYVQRGIVIVNTSRGNVIHEADLEQALHKGWIGAVGLDVFEKEPLPRNSGLLQFENVVLTPHLGATTREAFARASNMAADQVLEFLESGRTTSELPPSAPWFEAEF